MAGAIAMTFSFRAAVSKKKQKRADGGKKNCCHLSNRRPHTHTHFLSACTALHLSLSLSHSFLSARVRGRVCVKLTNRAVLTRPLLPPTAVIYNTSKKALRAVRASSALQMHFIASETHTHTPSHIYGYSATHTHAHMPCNSHPHIECLGFVLHKVNEIV